MRGKQAQPKQNVTVTVRPDGTYYIEKAQPHPTMKLVRATPGAPFGAQITSTLKDVAGIVAVVKTVAPGLGPYGTLAALGFGVLRALATPEPGLFPAPLLPAFRLRRVQKAKVLP